MLIKRFFDFFVSIVGLIILSPLLIFLSLLIALESRGPIIFKQDRVGLNGKVFKTLKFRTMRIDEKNYHPLTIKNDPRITRVGNFLRNTKLDELPQLFNVVRGEMSLVGPRPETMDLIKFWPEDKKRIILSIRPGITDNASIKYFKESDLLEGREQSIQIYAEDILPKKMNIYEDYVTNQTFLNDLKIIFKTIFKVIRQ